MTLTQPTGESVATEVLLDWLRSATIIRAVDEALLRLRGAGVLQGAVHPTSGQEAIAVGACAALRDIDVVISYYRGIGHALAVGADLAQILAERLGGAGGYCHGHAGEFLICRDVNLQFTAGIIGSGAAIGIGAAMAGQITRDGTVTLVFFGDGALAAGIVHEAFNIAATWRLPVVFVCEHNGYQDHTRTEEVYPDTDLTRLAAGHRIPARGVDGNDASAVFVAVNDSVRRSRDGAGPQFVEARTYLRRFHLQFDEPPPPYRPREEEGWWLARDPIDVMRGRLLDRGIAETVIATAVEQARTEVAAVVRAAVRDQGRNMARS